MKQSYVNRGAPGHTEALEVWGKGLYAYASSVSA
jgi:hypothetical protein